MSDRKIMYTHLMASAERSFGLLDFTTQFLYSSVILADVLALLLLVQLDEVVHHALIEVLTAQVSVSIGSNDLEYTVVDGEQADIEGTTAQIEHQHVLLAVLLVQAVRDRGGSRFVDDPHHDQTGDSSGILSCLQRTKKIST